MAGGYSDLDCNCFKIPLSRGLPDASRYAGARLTYWVVRELGMSLTDLAREFEMSVAGIGYAVERGERIVPRFELTLRDDNDA